MPILAVAAEVKPIGEELRVHPARDQMIADVNASEEEEDECSPASSLERAPFRRRFGRGVRQPDECGLGELVDHRGRLHRSSQIGNQYQGEETGMMLNLAEPWRATEPGRGYRFRLAASIPNRQEKSTKSSYNSFYFSFPRSAWERTAATLRVAVMSQAKSIFHTRGTATQSVAAVRSHAERGNEKNEKNPRNLHAKSRPELLGSAFEYSKILQTLDVTFSGSGSGSSLPSRSG